MQIVQSYQRAEMEHRFQAEREERWVKAESSPNRAEPTAVSGEIRRESVERAQSLRAESITQMQAPVAPGSGVQASAPVAGDIDIGEQGERLNMLLLAKTLERLTGKAVQFFNRPILLPPESLQAAQEGAQRLMAAVQNQGHGFLRNGVFQPTTWAGGSFSTELSVTDGRGREGWVREERVSEFESLHAQFSGSVVQADGTERAFEVELKLERAFEGVAWQRAPLHDPLVIQVENRALNLSSERFSFDLNSDGVEELLPQLGAGYGFLALDRNGDGQINDGRELFGAQTGQGFAELAEFDQDGNGFIDEGDAVYEKLAVWQHTGDEAAPKLVALADIGVEAISLQAVMTPFRFTDELGQTLGQLRSSAVVLGEQRASLIHQIDLAL